MPKIQRKNNLLWVIKGTFLHLLISCLQPASAQFYFERFDDISLTENTTNYQNAWVGGLNAPQFSVIDLNNDGIKDLFVFDRSGNKSLTFLNGGTPNTIDYTYAPQYERYFPAIRSWCLLRDFNADGKEDIFTSVPGGIKVYLNTSTATQLRFEELTPLLESFYTSFSSSIFVSSADIPSIIDADNDGDLDILTFELGTGNGDAVYYFKNRSIEKYGTRDSLDFILEQRCWGKFREDGTSCTVQLNACIGKLTNDTLTLAKNNLHAGSTLTVFDVTGDGLIDALIGDIGCSTMYLLTNAGSTSDANMGSINTQFPASKPIDMAIFPAAYYLDVNNDAKNDIVIAPNVTTAAENFTNCIVYLQTGTAQNPVFTYQSTPFLVNTLLDLGEGAYPAVVDVNADGLKDLIIGNFGYYAGNGNYTGKLAYLKNTGTTTQPAFDLNTRDFAAISTTNLKALFPTFADMDSDGDADLVLGDSEGFLNLFTNTAGLDNTIDISSQTASFKYQNIDVGAYATPVLVDLDKDGILDIVTGEKSTNISFYKNTSSSTPNFVLQTDSLGRLKTESAGVAVNGYSTTWIGDFDNNGDTELLITKADGTINRFDNVDNNLQGAFIHTDTFNPNMGGRISFTISDLDNDGEKELIVGAYRGGISFFKQAEPSGVTEKQALAGIKIYPNPANAEIYLHVYPYTSPQEVYITDIAGKIVLTKTIDSSTTTCNIAALPNGMYIVKVGLAVGKLLINR